MITHLILFGGVLFWTIIALAALVVTVCVGNEKGGGAVFATVAAVVILALFSNVSLASLTFGTFLLYLLAYLAVGTGWALTKWEFFLRRVKAYVLETKAAGKSKDHIETRLRYDFDVAAFPPVPSEQSSRISIWLFYWPASVVADASHKPAKALYRAVTGIMGKMSRSTFEGVELS